MNPWTIAALVAAGFVVLVSVLAALVAAGRSDDAMLRMFREEARAWALWLADGVPVKDTLKARADELAEQIRQEEAEVAAPCVIADDDIAVRNSTVHTGRSL